MNSNDYWQGRFIKLEEALLKFGIDAYDDIEKAYRKALASIDRDITSWYTRLATNNNISYADAKKLLTSNQLEEFRWMVEEYIECGSHNVDSRWTKQLENASAKVHISRLDAIKLQLQQHLEVLYGNQLDRFDAAMCQIYTEGYYRTVYELQKGGIGTNLHLLDEQRIQQVLSKPWATDGKDFSARIWESRDKLVNTLHTELTQAVIRGDGLKKVTDAIAQKMNTSKTAAGRLVMTESAFFASKSQLDSYKAMDVEQYEIVATLDRRTSEVCRGMDGKVFKLSEFKPGITAPPFHCWCRSYTAPYFADEVGVRVARDENDDTINVPDGMTYEDWQAVYVEKTRTLDEWKLLKKSRENDTIKEKLIADIKATGIKCQAVNYPPKPIDVDSLSFDDEHINKERQHGVSEEEAKECIRNACFSLSRWNGEYENYYTSNIIVYVSMENNKIRTAFKYEQFGTLEKQLVKVVEKYEKLGLSDNR